MRKELILSSLIGLNGCKVDTPPSEEHPTSQKEHVPELPHVETAIKESLAKLNVVINSNDTIGVMYTRQNGQDDVVYGTFTDYPSLQIPHFQTSTELRRYVFSESTYSTHAEFSQEIDPNKKGALFIAFYFWRGAKEGYANIGGVALPVEEIPSCPDKEGFCLDLEVDQSPHCNKQNAPMWKFKNNSNGVSQKESSSVMCSKKGNEM